MAWMSIIEECCRIIGNHEELDCESYGVSYYLSYDGNKIKFTRVTTSPTGEMYSDGGIDTKSCGFTLCEWDAPMKEYCNLAIAMQNRDELEYKYGEYVNYIIFQPIF